MLEHIKALKDVLIGEFYQLYDEYNDDEIYGCALIFNEYLLIDGLAISTIKSLFSDQEDTIQYLSETDKWRVTKWRYRTSQHSDSPLEKFRPIMVDYFQKSHVFGNPLLDPNTEHNSNNLELLIQIFKDAKDSLIEDYGLDIENIFFFISINNQPEIEINTARMLNNNEELIEEFIDERMPIKVIEPQNPPTRTKLNQSDKDMLISLGQMIEIDPYDYLEVAKEAYLLTLEPHFVDTNIYIQKLVQSIAAMDSAENGEFALDKEEILNRIDQFYNVGHIEF
jgi:hypothetical protein